MAVAAVVLLCAVIAWQLWMGLAKGRMYLSYTGAIERTKRPFIFWATFVFWALVLLFFACVFATGLWSLATGQKLP